VHPHRPQEHPDRIVRLLRRRYQRLTLSAGLLNGTSNFFCGAPAVTNASFGLFAIAARIKSIHIGSAARAPVSFSPSGRRSSNPIHVPQVTDGENPMNHASV